MKAVCIKLSVQKVEISLKAPFLARWMQIVANVIKQSAQPPSPDISGLSQAISAKNYQLSILSKLLWK